MYMLDCFRPLIFALLLYLATDSYITLHPYT